MVENNLTEPECEELFEHFRFTVDKRQRPLRIDKYLTHHIKNVSRNKVQQAALAGNIRVNGKAVKSSYKVKPNDNISVLLDFPPHAFEIIPQNIPLNIVYEDDDIIVINKDAGMVVHPAFGHPDGTVVNALVYHFNLTQTSSESLRPGLAHRLDKDTSGLIVIAKNDYVLAKLGKQFYERKVDKTYITLVWGCFTEDQGTINVNVGRSLKNRKRFTAFPLCDYGKPAITHYKVIERFKYTTLLECKPETGRTHQIRVHLKHIGHPLFNDKEYGGDKILKGVHSAKYRQFVLNCFKLCQRHPLHAKSLGFVHPTTQKKMFFDSELPDDMKMLIKEWREYDLRPSDTTPSSCHTT